MSRKLPPKRDYKTFTQYEDVFCGDGVPYYHKKTTHLKPDEREKLSQFGIQFKCGQLSPVEIAQIKRNWISFADQNKIAISECELFVSGHRHLTDGERRMKKNLLPHLGRGLEHRSGAQIWERARILLTKERSPELFAVATASVAPGSPGQTVTTPPVELGGNERIYRRHLYTVDFDAALLKEAAKKKDNQLTWLG